MSSRSGAVRTGGLEELQRVDAKRRAARRGARAAQEQVVARRHHRAAVERSPQPGHDVSDGYTPCSRSSQNSKYRASGSTGAPAASASVIDDAEPVQPLVGVRLGRPLVDQLREVSDMPERVRSSVSGQSASALGST